MLDATTATDEYPNAANVQCYEVVRTYLLAMQLDMETFANKLIDILHAFQAKITGTTVKEISLLQSLKKPYLPIRALLLRSLAEAIRDKNWKSYFEDSPLLHALLADDASLSMGLTEIMSMKKELPDLAEDQNLCQYHTHLKTEVCKVASSKEGKKVKKRKHND
jgi:hypothetical protein